jgi:hypothetical protein
MFTHEVVRYIISTNLYHESQKSYDPVEAYTTIENYFPWMALQIPPEKKKNVLYLINHSG